MSVHIVLPNDIDDPDAPSGGNIYDRKIIQGLSAMGWSVHEHAVPGSWPRPNGAERTNLADVLSALPDGTVVLLDGLVASAVPEVLVPQARRLLLVILVHMSLADESADLELRERQALSAASAIVTTSSWSRQRLLDVYALPAERVFTAPPGVDAAPLAIGSADGSRLLCVSAVAPHKGHDLLVRARATISDRSWTCVCVGTLRRDPGFVDTLHQQIRDHGIADRISFVGAVTGRGLDAQYAAADLLVLPTRGETYGMVVTEALARGIPVLATKINGVPEALGHAPDGSRPGVLIPPEDPAALADALRSWLDTPALRDQLRRSARERRTTLTGWADTSALIARVLSDVRVTR
ncbi:MAG: glycosyltransferase family 4 protein [Longispora sp.]|nr:glycosyltransferase family 4 protein [Longispora sp. (in: high G+C Gram-positive bacteria)]